MHLDVSALPAASDSIGSQGMEAMSQLREYMQAVDKTKNERNAVEDQFKGATADMQSKFLIALAAEGFIDSERITSENLEEQYR